MTAARQVHRVHTRDRRCQIRVALLSSHPLFRDGFRQALLAADQMVPVEAVRASEALTIAKEGLAEVLLIDVIDLPDGSIEMAEALARDYPKVRVILLADSERADDATAALEAGISGYVLKTIKGVELIEIVKDVHEGRCYIAPQLAARAIRLKYCDRLAAQDQRKLTHREAEVLSHLSSGMTNKEIAKKLNIGERTVKHHMTVILAKLNARNRVEAVLSAKQNDPSGR